MRAMKVEQGRVYLVGAGPGDPGLITVAGAEVLAHADVVLYDALAAHELLRLARHDAVLIPTGKRAGHPSMSQDEINDVMLKQAIAGHSVVRLKGGDPFVFGRGGEEAAACFINEVPFTVIPGVTSAIAAPAYAGIPVTHRNIARSLLIITGSEAADSDHGINWTAAAAADTVVLMMGNLRLRENLDRLIAGGKDPSTPAAMVSMGTRTSQQVIRADLATLPEKVTEAGVPAPALVVIGEVVRLGEELRWFRPGPLAGRRVVVTRARAQSSTLVTMLQNTGADVFEAPVISVAPPSDEDLAAALRLEWDWIVFTSANAVEAVRDCLASEGRDTRALANISIAAVGVATGAALLAIGITPDFVPTRATTDQLAREFPGARKARVLYPASGAADGSFAASLRLRGAAVTQVSAYENAPEALSPHAIAEVQGAAAVTFTSASTARNLAMALGGAELPATTKLVSMGPQTSNAVREFFGRVDVQAEEPSLQALVAAVCQALDCEEPF